MTPLRYLILLISILLIGIIVVGVYVNSIISDGLPSLEQLENPRQNFATRVYSADGKLLDHYFVERRISLPYDSIPKYFFNALRAVEDRKFDEHWGIHSARIIKAAIKNLFAMRTKEGASTVTMQLSRNLFFTQATTLERKIKEAVTAMQIERTYTKEEILEMYANTVAFGRGAYGIQVAAQVYFDKQAPELTLSECAFLVGLLKRPEFYNGVENYERALRRRNFVLYLMEEEGFISQYDRVSARKEPINFAKPKTREMRMGQWTAPHFVEMIRQELSRDEKFKDFDLYRDGLVIYTTLDSRLQDMAQQSVEEHFAEFQQTFSNSWNWARNQSLLNDLIARAIKNHPEFASASSSEKPTIEKALRNNKGFIDSVKNAATTVQVGAVIIDPNTGAILAMVGGSPKFMKENRDAKYSLNHVTQIRRQPGSAFKPFVYASALEQGLQTNAMIECGPFSYKLPSGEVWSPRGTGGCDPGVFVPLNVALQKSINTVSARLITQHTTPHKVIELASRMGISSPLMAVPALSLGGGGEVSPLELTSAYGSFASEGIYFKPYFITRIEDRNGNIIFEQKRSSGAMDAVAPRVAQSMIRMMQGTIDGGTAWRIRHFFTDCEAAGKTGTTNDYADAWFVGFTPQLVSGVWVGFDDRRVTFTGGYGYAAQAAAPIWGRLMGKIYKNEYLPYKQRKFSFSLIDSTKIVANPPVKYIEGNPIYDEIPAGSGSSTTNGEQQQERKRIFPSLNKPEDN